MRVALRDGQRVHATETGQRATCPDPDCQAELAAVISHDGKRLNHWRHFGEQSPNCVLRFAPKSEWHQEWQDRFGGTEVQEIIRRDTDGTKHIADVLIEPQRLTVEIQNSYQPTYEARSREEFWTRDGGWLVWVLNAQGNVPLAAYESGERVIVVVDRGTSVQIQAAVSEPVRVRYAGFAPRFHWVTAGHDALVSVLLDDGPEKLAASLTAKADQRATEVGEAKLEQERQRQAREQARQVREAAERERQKAEAAERLRRAQEQAIEATKRLQAAVAHQEHVKWHEDNWPALCPEGMTCGALEGAHAELHMSIHWDCGRPGCDVLRKYQEAAAEAERQRIAREQAAGKARQERLAAGLAAGQAWLDRQPRGLTIYVDERGIAVGYDSQYIPVVPTTNSPLPPGTYQT